MILRSKYYITFLPVKPPKSFTLDIGSEASEKCLTCFPNIFRQDLDVSEVSNYKLITFVKIVCLLTLQRTFCLYFLVSTSPFFSLDDPLWVYPYPPLSRIISKAILYVWPSENRTEETALIGPEIAKETRQDLWGQGKQCVLGEAWRKGLRFLQACNGQCWCFHAWGRGLPLYLLCAPQETMNYCTGVRIRHVDVVSEYIRLYNQSLKNKKESIK